MLDTFKKATPEALAEIREEMAVRRTEEVFLLFGMGSQFDHLIHQQVAKLGVFCLVADPASVTADNVRALGPIGIILSGGPASVHSEPPPFDAEIFDLGIPVLGICLGFQMWAKHIGCEVVPGSTMEFGTHNIRLLHADGVFDGFAPDQSIAVLQSHGDEVRPYEDLRIQAFSESSGKEIVAAARWEHLHGVQFHPEVTETVSGPKMFENFVFGICGAQDRFPAQDQAAVEIAKLKHQVGTKKVLLLLSAGSDSSVTAYLLKHATSGREQLRGLYIRGIDRPDDEQVLLRFFGNQPWIDVKIVDATEQFLGALAGKLKMSDKRDAVREVYKPLAEQEAAAFGASFIAQGTLYTDLSESGHQKGGARKAIIKKHHNTNLNFSLPELTPLADYVKDGARSIGRVIGVPEELLTRHPFPGPGLVVRIEGEITAEKLAMARALDGIYLEEIHRAGLYHEIWQAGIVVTQSLHTVTKGDNSGIGVVVMYWAVNSVNGFTARAAHLPHEFHQRLARRIGNEVMGVGAVSYRVSDKPFSTIEAG